MKITSRFDPARIVLERPDLESLSGAYLTRANLSDAYLCDANLTRAYLTDANLTDANLTGAYLTDANLTGANLTYVNLRNADLTGANLTYVNLRYAYLSGANLTCVNLRNADLDGANLTGANLTYANLSDAYLSGANLTGANLTGANLSDVKGAQVPIIPEIDRVILNAITIGGKLAMNTWHSCETTHCRAGWAIHLAGEAGYALENLIGSNAAGALIYAASRPGKPVPNFFASDEQAMADIRACAEGE